MNAWTSVLVDSVDSNRMIEWIYFILLRIGRISSSHFQTECSRRRFNCGTLLCLLCFVV